MKMKNKIKGKIKSLEQVIEFRDNDGEWQKKPVTIGSVDDNKYNWFHAGERDRYRGRLEALKELLRELR